MVPALRRKLGHGNFAIVMKRKKYRVSREGHLGPNGQRVEAPMGELKEEEEILCNIPGGACFVRGTLVSTERGLRAIETLKAGELVRSRDEATGQTALKPIAQTFERYATMLALTWSNGETIETTREHPFYVVDRGFVKAGELGIGTSIVTRAGPSVQLVSVKSGAAQTVYNFEVEDYHTYFVGQGEVWVHNADYLTPKSGKWERPNVQDDDLKDAMDNLWRPEDQRPGGTIGELLREIANGDRPPRHLDKAQNRLAQLRRRVMDRDNPLSQLDRAAAERVIGDLRDAIGRYNP